MIDRITDVYADVVLTPAECDEALASFPPTRPGTTNQSSVKRSSSVGFVRDPQWSFWPKLRRLIFDVNNNLQRFDLATVLCPAPLVKTEPVQLAEYRVGDEYDWHLDIGPYAAALRKLSLSVQLTDPGEYEGGDLEIRGVSGGELRAPGTVIIFPSFLLHRVTPVTRGIRRSLVAWAIGEKPFR